MAASVKGQDPNVHEKVLRVHDQNSISQNSPGEPCLFYLDLRKLENCALEAALALVELRAGAATVGKPPGIHDDPSDGGGSGLVGKAVQKVNSAYLERNGCLSLPKRQS